MAAHRHEPSFAPRLMPAPEAAHYLGVSESTLRLLGIPRKVLGAKRLYDRLELDRFASSLPVEGEHPFAFSFKRMLGKPRLMCLI